MPIVGHAEPLPLVMNFDDLSSLSQLGFRGGRSVRELRSSIDSVPEEAGVYLVATPQRAACTVTSASTGYSFKRRNPTVDEDVLRSRLALADSPILYIGKAGGKTLTATLRTRLAQYLAFGIGRSQPHWGGRCIWQLAEAESLLMYWRHEPVEEPRAVEKRLIALYRERFGSLPFANLRG